MVPHTNILSVLVYSNSSNPKSSSDISDNSGISIESVFNASGYSGWIE